jgi:hypothetical protein
VEAFANLRRHLERFASPNEISRTAIQQLRQSIDEVAKRGPATSADRLATSDSPNHGTPRSSAYSPLIRWSPIHSPATLPAHWILAH